MPWILDHHPSFVPTFYFLPVLNLALNYLPYLSPLFIKPSQVNYLSDPSPIIDYACHSLNDSLTNCYLVNLIDVILACEDGNP